MSKPNEITAPTEEVVVTLDPEVEKLLEEAGVDLQDVLGERHRDWQVRRGLDPAATQGGKSAALIIIASGFTIGAIGFAISRIIDSVGRNKKAVVYDRVCEPVYDADGSVARRPDGTPAMQWRETGRMLEATQGQDRGSALQAEIGKQGLRVSLAERPVSN